LSIQNDSSFTSDVNNVTQNDVHLHDPNRVKMINKPKGKIHKVDPRV